MEPNVLQQNLTSQVYAERVAHLYSQGPSAYVFTIIIAIILAYLQRSFIPDKVILIWFCYLFLITSSRTILVFAFHRIRRSNSDIRPWAWAYLVGTVLAGAGWGSAAIFLFPSSNIAHQMFVVFVLGGMSAAAISVLSASMIAFFLFALPTLLPLASQIYLQGEALSVPMSTMVLLYIVGISVAARGANQMIIASLTLRFDNRELTKQIAERQLAEEALFQQKDRLQTTVYSLAEGIAITSANSLIEYLNPAAEQISGWMNSDATGEPIHKVFPYTDERTGKPKTTAVQDCLQSATRAETHARLIARDEQVRLIEEVATPLKDRGKNTIGAVAIIRDVTQVRKHSLELAYQASHDALTDLPNRTMLCDRLAHAIARANRAKSFVAVLFMDLDRFKTVNDSLGHAAGDALLKKVAARLRGSAREQDTVARFGGDEFIIVLEDLYNEELATIVAMKIVKAIAVPMALGGNEVSITASIGITLFPKDGDDAESLLKNADTAMYSAKQQGRDNFQFYASETHAKPLRGN